MPKQDSLVLLKLGGSLITDKAQPHTARPEVLSRLVGEIAQALRDNPKLHVLLGHGSGSFGHVPAKKYATRAGVRTSEEWQGFVEVWRDAWQLNQRVMQALAQADLPAIAFAPAASVTSSAGQVSSWNLTPIKAALDAGLLPVIYGDVVFDLEWGGTILSTEDLFEHLANNLHPQRILLAGIDAGVWWDFPVCTRLVEKITPSNWPEIRSSLGGSAATDVTGGMLSKVQASLALVQQIPGLEVRIFSGEIPGAVHKALLGNPDGTRVCAR